MDRGTFSPEHVENFFLANSRKMTLFISNRTVSAIRHSVLVNDESWMTTRIPLYYLDLAVPVEVLFQLHFAKVFPKHNAELDILKGFRVVPNKRRFHPDDTFVGCGPVSSDSFCFYATTSTADRRDRIGLTLFFEFLKSLDADAPSLASGEPAVRFVNLAWLCGYEQWKEKVVRRCPHPHHTHLLVDRVFAYVYPSILHGLYKKRRERPLTVKKFWDLFCVTDQTRLTLLQKVPDVKHLKFMLDVANETRFDFWGMRSGGGGFTERIILPYVRTNRCHLAAMMLDYGFTLERVVPEDPDEKDISWRLENLLTRPSLIFTFKDLIPEGFMVWFLAKCYSICGNNLLELPGFVKLFRKLSRSSRLPSLPPSIVRKNLQKVTSSPFAVNEMTYIYEACDVYPADCSGVPPLSHLSRCFIRERLAANYQLPAAIDNFCIPEIAKRYLRLDY